MTRGVTPKIGSVELHGKEIAIDEPRDYYEPYIRMLCRAISGSDRGVVRLIEEMRVDYPNFPSENTLRYWLAKDGEFFRLYTIAREMQAEYLVEQILVIADDSSEDLFITVNGVQKLNKEFVERSKLRVDARKWIASKILPKKYGDKIEHTGSVSTEKPQLTIIVGEKPSGS